MSSALTAWAPPAAVAGMRRMLPERLQRFEAASSWADAESRAMGYEAVARAGLIATPQRKEASLALLDGRELQLLACLGIVLAQRPSDRPFSVVDVGGAHGYYRSVAAAAFPEVSLRWLVVETPTLVASAASRADDGLAWTTDLDAALSLRPDFVLASAVVNYLPQPLVTVRELARHSAWTLITRLPLWPVPTHQAAIQRLGRRAGAGSYPTWFFSEDQFVREVQELGSVAARFAVPEDAAYFAGRYLTYCGLLLQWRDADDST